MKQRRRNDCPIPACEKTNLLKLSNHLANVHHLNSIERKPWLERVREKNIKTMDREVTAPCE